MAGLGLVVVNSLSESAWARFTIAATIPIALLMGIWMFQLRKGKVAEATLGGVIYYCHSLLSMVDTFQTRPLRKWFMFDHSSLTILLAMYGFCASVFAGVVVIVAPRLFELNNEISRYWTSRTWHRHRGTLVENAGMDDVCPWRRANYSRGHFFRTCLLL